MDMTPVVLDLDGSVGTLPGELRIALADWQEALRFGCSRRTRDRFAEELQRRLEPALEHGTGTVLLGSGDFHHLSHILIARCLASQADALDVIVLDNHPDNMRFPLGTHCGSWVAEVSALRGVAHVHVVGITSGDVGWAHSLENRLGPLFAGRVTYWCTAIGTGWARWSGLGGAVRAFADPDRLVAAFTDFLGRSRRPVYLSIDKDVFAPEVVHTNWDQGSLLQSHAYTLIRAMTGRVVGSDITGDISAYRYRTRWKRWLSRWDGQEEPIDADLAGWRIGQNQLDLSLVEHIRAAHRGRPAPAPAPTDEPSLGLAPT